MGMFDYVKHECDCPRCGAKVKGFQSKDGPCMMITLTPLQVNRMYSSCNTCGQWVSFERDTDSPGMPEYGAMDDYRLEHHNSPDKREDAKGKP